MTKFEKYLLQQQFTVNTTNTYSILVGYYLQYLKNKNIKNNCVDFNVILKYITYLKRKNGDRSVNLNLIAIRHYYNFKKVKVNPVKVHIKRKPTVISSNTLSTEQLTNIYNEFNVSDTDTSIRNKVLLGLYIFQGIQSTEVKNLTVDDIDFNKMTMTIDKTVRSNKRIIPLDIKQVLLLSQYIYQNRNQLLLNHKELTDKLIITSTSDSIQGVIYHLSKKLKKSNNKISLSLIRTSVIRNWLQLYDLRKVQYLSGHRYISSTERYVVKDLQKLKKSVVKFHPL